MIFHRPVNSVVGTQIGDQNHYYTLNRLMARYETGVEMIERLRARYVEPDGWETVTRAMYGHRVAILSGPRDRGLRPAAIMLLSGVAHLVVQEILLDEDNLTADLPTDQGHGYFVDLRGLGEGALTHFDRRVDSYVDRLRAAGSWLVVLVDPRRWNRVGGGLGAVSLPPPPAAAVLRRHLLADGLSEEQGDWWLSREEVRRLLDGASPADAERLAVIILDTEASAQRSDDPADRVPVIESAYKSWRDQLAVWIAANPDLRTRCLLIALAAIEGADTAAVLAAADALAEAVGVPASPGWPLTAPTSQERIDGVDARPVGDRLQFRRPLYGPAVLDFAWDAWPPLRPVLQKWLADLATARMGSTDIGQRVARTTIDVALRQNDAGFAHHVAARWSTDPTCRPLAIDVLATAASSPQIGSSVRRMMYQWAVAPRTSDPLLQVVAETSIRISGHLPEIALTRLRHVAAHPGAGVRAAADGLVDMVDRTPTLIGRAIREAAAWRDGDNPARAAAGVEAFLMLASAQRIVEVPTMDLVGGWRTALTGEPTDRTATAVARWLTAAGELPALRAAVIDVLATSTRSRSTAGMHLLRLSERWALDAAAEEAGERAGVRDELVRRVLEQDPVVRVSQRLSAGEEGPDHVS